MVGITYLVITFVAFPGFVVNPRKPFFTLSTSLSLNALEICKDNHFIKTFQMWNLVTRAEPVVTITYT